MKMKVFGWWMLVLAPAAVWAANFAPDHNRIELCPDQCTCKNYQASCNLHRNISFVKIPTEWRINSFSVTGNISHFPESFPVGMASVTKFKWTNTLIGKIQQMSFEHLQNITSLDLSRNDISFIHEHSLRVMEKMIHANFSHNIIRFLNKDMFQRQTELKELDLSFNRLQYLKIGVFHSLRKLEFLDLSHNELRHMKDHLLENLQNLKTLLLNDNKLVSLSPVVLEPARSIQIISLQQNNWECSCLTENLLLYIQKNSHLIHKPHEIKCKQPSDWSDKAFHTLRIDDLPCTAPNISKRLHQEDLLIRSDVSLTCDTNLYPESTKYWITPWGQALSNGQSNIDWNARNISMRHQQKFYAYINMEANTKLYVDNNNALHIEGFRGSFRGNYTCVAFNKGGETNKTVDVGVYSDLPHIIYISYFFSTGGPALMLMVALLVTLVKLCLKCICKCNCCCCCKKSKIVEPIEDIEVQIDVESKMSILEGCNIYDYDDPPSPKSSLHSPWSFTPRASPRKCATPTGESSDGWLPTNIMDTMDEVKLRLDKKIERVRSHYHSIKSSGSHYITNIKDTGSQAANRVKAGMVLGVEQVKFSVLSIKEFCGTGDMGTQTISVVSVSTDVDTAQETKVVKAVTYV